MSAVNEVLALGRRTDMTVSAIESRPERVPLDPMDCEHCVDGTFCDDHVVLAIGWDLVAAFVAGEAA